MDATREATITALIREAQTNPVAAQHLMTELTRLECARNHPTAGALALACDPMNNRQVPWLEVVDRALEWALHTPNARLMISVPSQEGKSTRAAVWGTVRALVLNPDRRVIIATHSQELALTHSEKIRAILATHGTGAKDTHTGAPLPDRLGIGLGSKTSAGRWTLAGHNGGVVAVGTGTALPGKPCDLMILDDLHPSMEAADSPAENRKLRNWWDAVASQRLAPGAPVIIIGTRWSQHDIFTYLLEQEPQRWRVLNFPAIADHGTHDSLNREPGTPLESARGQRDWEYQRSIKPARVWAATYQGTPIPTTGGLFHSDWFDTHRITTCPPFVRKIVAVDPADSGAGDQTGIIAMGQTSDRRVIITHDHTGLMTSDQWARRAAELAKDTGATELIVEGYSAANTYVRLLQAGCHTVGHTARVIPWRGRGNAVQRAAGLRNAIETGSCALVGNTLSQFEIDATSWVAEKHCPDRIAAATVGYSHLTENRPATIATPRPGGWGQLPTGF